MKSTKVQTLGKVALHATTACTDEASIVGSSSLNWGVLVLHGEGSVHECVCTCYSLVTRALMWDHYRTSFTDMKQRGTLYTKYCNVNKMADSSWLGPSKFLMFLTSRHFGKGGQNGVSNKYGGAMCHVDVRS